MALLFVGFELKLMWMVGWTGWYLLGIVIATLVILMTLFHKEIVNWLHPVAVKMKEYVERSLRGCFFPLISVPMVGIEFDSVGSSQ